MAAKSIKFEISLEKLSVKFEGDIQTAERLQGEITGALTTLASAQHKMLAPAKVITPAAIEAGRGRGRGRRRRKTSEGIDPSILEGAVSTNGDADGDADNGNGTRARRSSGGATALLTALSEEGFFGSGKRTISEIRAELGRKGHTFKSNEVSPSLVALTKSGMLKREKNTDDQWIYFTS